MDLEAFHFAASSIKFQSRKFSTCWFILVRFCRSFKWVFAHTHTERERGNERELQNKSTILKLFCNGLQNGARLIFGFVFDLFRKIQQSSRYNEQWESGKKNSERAYLVGVFIFIFIGMKDRKKEQKKQSTASIQAYWHEFNPFAGSNNQHFFGRLHCMSTRRFHMKNHRSRCIFARLPRAHLIQSRAITLEEWNSEAERVREQAKRHRCHKTYLNVHKLLCVIRTNRNEHFIISKGNVIYCRTAAAAAAAVALFCSVLVSFDTRIFALSIECWKMCNFYIFVTFVHVVAGFSLCLSLAPVAISSARFSLHRRQHRAQSATEFQQIDKNSVTLTTVSDNPFALKRTINEIQKEQLQQQQQQRQQIK